MVNFVFQLKRFAAQSLGTTYVYDFPELFKQVRSGLKKNFVLLKIG